MAVKLQRVSELAGQTAKNVTRDVDGWKSYLAVAARLYKYPFDEQLLIYAQRPDATACASMELWNGTMKRWVKPGSKGIALIRKDRRGKPSLEYVFDYADTRPVREAREPYLWQMRKEHRNPVLTALRQRYGPDTGGDIGDQLMDMAVHAVDEVYRERLRDLAYDTGDSLLEELDDLNLEVRFRRLMTASVQYALLTRCGLDPMDYLDDEDFDGISEFSTPAVLHHLGSAASEVSKEVLTEIGTAIRQYEQGKNNQRIFQNSLAKGAETGYTTDREEFNDVKCESKERSLGYGADLHESGRLPATRSDDGRGERTGGDSAGQVRAAAGELPEGASQWDVQLHAPDGQAGGASAGDRPAGAGAGGQYREGSDEAPGRERGPESQGSDGVGTGGEQLHPSGGGNGTGGDRLQVKEEQWEAAGEQPAASASPEPEVEAGDAPSPGMARFSLFPTVEEQVEAIAETQAEEQRQTEQPVFRVPDAVADRALACGGNRKHSIERIVAFFQRNPSSKDAAAFLEQEYGVGGKGLTIAKKQYAMWFDDRGVHICPGNNTYGTVSTHLPWPAVAARVSLLLRDGMFASQEKMNAAQENELNELANSLAYLRSDFSDAAKEKDYLHTVSKAYGVSRSDEGIRRIRELLRDPESRRRVLSELRAFTSSYATDRSLLELRPPVSLPTLTRRIASLDKPVTEFKAATDGFAPAQATFITEDEIDQFLMDALTFEDGKIRVYSYFMQGHSDKECADFLRRECGDAGHNSESRRIWSDGKGIKFNRLDENSGAAGYDTVHLNWNQAQKRVRGLIETERFLTKKEQESLPKHDKDHTAKMVYQFFSHLPDCQHRPYTEGATAVEAAKQILPLLETSEMAIKLFDTVLSDFAPLSPNVDGYEAMMFAMRDIGAYVRGDSPLFTPLPESVLQAEREVKARHRKKNQAAEKGDAADVPAASGEASGDLAAAARALASKRKPVAEAQGDGQFSLFSSRQSAEAEPQEQRGIEELERYQKNHPAPEPEKKYSLGYGFFGNGLTVWNSLEQENGDYKTIAHIAPDRSVKFYVDNLPEEVKWEIEHAAATSDARISATQDVPVFSAPPQVPEQQQEQGASRSPWWDEYTALKENYPDCLMLYQVGDFFELFGEDAKNAAAVLGLTLTTRPIGGADRVEMCGIPLHALQQSVESLRGQYTVAISFVDAKTGERQTRALTPLNSNTIPNSFELEYQMLSRLKSDCEYFLGAGGRAQKHLSEGSAEAQIAKMRELYDTLPEKPEWLTAEDIDRYEVKMTDTEPEQQAAEQNEAPDPVDDAPTANTYETIVTAEEAPLLARLLANARINPERIDHENGEVTFRVAVAQKDALDRLITKLRTEISKGVEASYGKAPAKKSGRTRPEINYRAFAKLFPEIISGEYRSMRLQAGPSYMPLHVEWIGDGIVALGHTYLQNGDTMNDPEMTFRVDREKGTLEALTFQQDGGLPIYQQVYPEPGKWIPKLRSNLNQFAAQWMKNITEQRYVKERAVAQRDGEDTEFFFDPDGTPRSAHDILMQEAEQDAPANAITLYREALSALVGAVRNSSFYDYLRDRDTDYENARAELDAEIAAMMDEIKEDSPALYEAYHNLPKFREWLAEDILEQTYQDYMTDPRDAVRRYADAPDAPEWIHGGSLEPPAEGQPQEQPGTSTETPPAPEAVPVITGTDAPGSTGTVWRTPGGKEYRAGDTAGYVVDGKQYQYVIDSIGEDYIYYTFPDLVQAPVEMSRDKFEELLDNHSHILMHGTNEPSQEAPAEGKQEPGEAVPVERDFAPNVEEYLNLKVQHPDKLIGVQVGEFMMFYGKDAKTAAPALGTNAPMLEIPGLGATHVTGVRQAWQATLKKLLEHGHSVLLAQPDPEHGAYEIIKEGDISEYVPLGKELTIDGRRMKVDSIDYANGKVSLMDMELAEKNRYPVFREEPIALIRECVIEAERQEFERTVHVEEMLNAAEAAVSENRDGSGAELDEAKRLIQSFCAGEYGQDEVDFFDLTDIGLAYTTTEDEKHEIQASVNLVDFSVTRTLDGQLVEERRYRSLRELIDNELAALDFDDLVYLEGEPEALLANKQSAAWKPEPAPEPETVEIDGGRLIPPPVEYTSKVTGRVNAGAFDVVFEELHFGPERHNFHITNNNLGAGGPKTKYQYNVAAIRTLKKIEAEGRLASPEEQEVLSRYVGWGSLAPAFDEQNKAWAKEFAELRDLLTRSEYAAARATTLNAHYTSPTVIKAIYEAVERMGFQPGNVLEPSCGIGNFFGLLPEALSGANLYGVELDELTGRIAKQLYQKAHITIDGFENTDHPDDFFDLAVGNVPFGSYKVHDRRYNHQNLQIHDYFLTKTLDKLRPGGIMAVITSKGTMDKKNSKVREALAQKADLLGAIRLPNNTFKANAGTEVTSDILFFQKRATVPEKLPEWVESGQTADGVPLNQYYLQHPEMVLGTMTLGKSLYGNDTETACYPIEGADLMEQLAEAISHITPPDRELLDMDAPEQEDGKAVESIPADPNVRNFSYTMSKGMVYFRENSRMVPVELGKKPAERVKGMIGIRDSTRKLIDLQLKGAADVEIKKEQANLNRLYDIYTKKYGILNSAGNRLAFNQDSSYPLLCSLEVLDDEGNFKRKADMFTKRTIQHHEAVTSVDTAVEALAVSIGERACVDLGFMDSLMGGSDKIPQIVEDLKGVIFKDPATGPFDMEAEDANWDKGWQTADEYLSGDVRVKLAQARAAAEKYPEFAINVEKLEQVQPKDLTAAEISVRIGAPWVKPKYYQQFIFELLQTPEYLRGNKIDVVYNRITGEWNVRGKSEDRRDNARIYATYGTKRKSAYVIFENLLNQRDTRVYDEDAEGKRILNPKHTAIAQQKAEAIDQAFKDWIFKDPERRADLCATYNRIFNSKRPREYNGDHIIFAGMNPEIRLEPHQRNAVARMLYGGNSLLAHCVGAGKTFEMTAAAMESKRLGLCQKSLFVVPNHLTEQWGSDFLTLYPGAKVLVATKKDFKPKNRKKFCARIATGGYDAIIIGHSQFEKIPLSPERQKMVIEDQIGEIMDAIAEAKREKEENWTIKQMEATKRNLETKLKKLTDKKKDDTVTFEELGIDRLFVDEAHYYKNLFLHTKMRNVAGITQTEAQKSTDMFGKCRYLDELTGGKGVTFATGTPVSNSMVELYTMMRYLQFGMLEEAGLSHFDDWAAMFGEKVSAVELKPEGTGFRSKTRFARFYNLPELMNLWKEAADIQTAEMLNLPVPKAEYITVTTEPSAAQKEMVQSLAERAEAVRNGDVEPTKDNMLKITSDGRKLALDQRMMNPLLGDDPNSKVNACVKNVFELWQESTPIKGAQLVFCDLSTPKGRSADKKTGKSKREKIIEEVTEQEQDPDAVEEDAEGVRLEMSVYSDIRAKLIAKGIPANEIAFIHDANTDAQKAELFAKVRSGQVRVLLGSTQKMGAGTNVQTRLVASHDLDCPWRPADLEQRAGRIVRRGNENEVVKIYRYVTKGTFDAYNWGLVENKQKFIGQIMTGKSPARSIEDVDATALSYAEVKMLATGDPRIKEKMELDIQVSKLKMLRANHMAQKYEMEDMVIKHYPKKMAEARMFIRALTEDMQIRDMHPVREDAFSMTVCGKTYTERKAAGEAILAACKSMTEPDKPLDLGQFRGFPMQLHLKGEKFVVSMKQNLTYTADLSDEPVGNIARINHALEKMTENLENQKRGLVTLESSLEHAREEAARPFPQEEELAVKAKRLSELNAELDHDGKGGKERDQGNDMEQEDGQTPPRVNPVPPIPGGDKPSIRAALRSYTPPAPAAAGPEKVHYREAVR